MKLVILEYGIAFGTENPTGYDPYAGVNEKYRKVILPSNYHVDSTIPWSVRSSQHMNGIVGVINHWKKRDFDIVSLPYMHAENWLRDNYKDIAIISMSVGGFFNSEWLEQYKDDIYFVQAAGNDGNMGEGLGAQNLWNGAVIGAVNENFVPENYSSWGKDLVTHAGIVLPEITWTNGYETVTKAFKGTSEATPQHATQVMNMICDFKIKYGRRPTVKEILATVAKYTVDIHTLGKDAKTGYGYYEYKEGEMVRIMTWTEEKEEARLWAMEQGITDGTRPTAPMTREEYWVMEYRKSKKIQP